MKKLFLVVLLAGLCLAGCKRKADTKPLDKAGVRFSVIERLHEIKVTDSEVAQLVKARQAGMHDDNCLELVRLARGRGAEFTDGDSVATLAGVQFTQEEVLEMARLNQLGLWIGEVQAMRFAGVSKAVIMTLARSRGAGRAVPSSPNVVRLQDAGLTDNEMMDLFQRGITDAEAEDMARARMPRGGAKFRSLR
jgi:hypothetical protein